MTDKFITQEAPHDFEVRPDFGYAPTFAPKTFKYESTEQEQREMQAFVAEHDKRCAPSKSTTGEKYAITLIPGGLGTLISIRCLICKQATDVTDTDNW